MKHKHLQSTDTNYTHHNIGVNRFLRIPFNLYTQPQIFDKNID